MRHEKGQAIVLIAAIMIGLIAMLGLAIDGGGMFFLKRDLQNATDAAIVAATYAKCSGGTNNQVQAAALEAAEKNGFIAGEEIGGVTTSINVVTGAAAVPTGITVSNPDDYVAVSITAGKEKYFIQIVYGDNIDVTAKAVGKCNRFYVAENQRAIFASGECNGGCGVSITGSSSHVVGGSHSNSCTSQPTNGSIDPPNSADNPSGCPPAQCPSPLPTDTGDIAMPVVYRYTDFDNTSNDIFAKTAALQGKYFFVSGGGVIPGAGGVTDTAMKNGALIVSNGDITIKANSLNNATYKVTIVSTGNIKTNGNVTNKTFSSFLNQLMGDTHYSLLFFSELDKSNATNCAGGANAGIDISGNNWTMNGMLYAPKSGINMSGSSYYLIGAIWARYVNLAASSSYIEYNPNGVPVSQTTISLPSN